MHFSGKLSWFFHAPTGKNALQILEGVEYNDNNYYHQVVEHSLKIHLY